MRAWSFEKLGLWTSRGTNSQVTCTWLALEQTLDRHGNRTWDRWERPCSLDIPDSSRTHRTCPPRIRHSCLSHSPTRPHPSRLPSSDSHFSQWPCPHTTTTLFIHLQQSSNGPSIHSSAWHSVAGPNLMPTPAVVTCIRLCTSTPPSPPLAHNTYSLLAYHSASRDSGIDHWGDIRPV